MPIEGETASQNIEKIKRLIPVAQELDCSMAQLAIAWCLKNHHVSSVITGASRPSQVVENMHAMKVFEDLDDEVMAHIDAVLETAPEPEQDWRTV